MSLEHTDTIKSAPHYSHETIRLAQMFSELNEANPQESVVFSELESDLDLQGFFLESNKTFDSEASIRYSCGTLAVA